MPNQQTVVDLGRLTKQKYRGAYDDLEDAELGRLVKQKYPGSYDDFAEPEGPGWLSRAASTAWERVNPVTQVKGLVKAAGDLPGTLETMGRSQDELRLRAAEEFKKGNYAEAARAALNWFVPVLGPESQRIGDVAVEKGATSPEFVGEMAGLATNLAAPAAVSKIRGVRVAPKISPTDAKTTAALDYLEDAGGVTTAGQRTGNRALSYLQESADTTILGSEVRKAADRRNIAAMRTRADELAARTGVGATSPEQAGGATRRALESRVKKFGSQADTQYNKFREVVDRPENMERVPTGEMRVDPVAMAEMEQLSQGMAKKAYGRLNDGERALVDRVAAESGIDITPQPVMVEMQTPVDLRPIKAAVEPILEDTKLWPAAERTASRGYSALKEIKGAPDYVPAPLAEKYLGGLKDLARIQGRGVAKDASQGLASFAVEKLQTAIDAKIAAKTGSEGLIALRKGRRADALKWATDDIVEQLRTEPVQLFNQATFAKDAGIGLLRKVAKESPGSMRRIGRAWLDNVVAAATPEGDIGLITGGRRLASQWNNLGPSTKRLLFTPEHVADLDKFFRGASKLSESLNPSGTAYMGLSVGQAGFAISLGPLWGPAYLVGAGGVSKLLRSPAGTQALLKGLTVPLGDKAATAAITAKILQIAGDDARPIGPRSQLPKAAEAAAPDERLVASR